MSVASAGKKAKAAVVAVLPSTSGGGGIPAVVAPVQQPVEEAPSRSPAPGQGGGGDTPGSPSEPLEAPEEGNHDFSSSSQVSGSGGGGAGDGGSSASASGRQRSRSRSASSSASVETGGRRHRRRRRWRRRSSSPPRPGVPAAGVVALGRPGTPPPPRTLAAALGVIRQGGLALAAGAGRTGRFAAIIGVVRRQRRLRQASASPQ